MSMHYDEAMQSNQVANQRKTETFWNNLCNVKVVVWTF